MAKSNVQLDPQVAVPEPGVSSAPGHLARGELEALFDEVNALHIRLKQSARKLHSEGDSALSGQDVLQILSEGEGRTVPQIARIRATSRQNIQVLVNRLKARGSVELISNPAHKKSALVRLTARGRALLATAIGDQEKFKAGLLPHFSENEIGDAVRLLRRLRELLNQPLGLAAIANEGSGGSKQRPEPDRRKETAAAAVSEPPARSSEMTAGREAQIDENELPVNLL